MHLIKILRQINWIKWYQVTLRTEALCLLMKREWKLLFYRSSCGSFIVVFTDLRLMYLVQCFWGSLAKKWTPYLRNQRSFVALSRNYAEGPWPLPLYLLPLYRANIIPSGLNQLGSLFYCYALILARIIFMPLSSVLPPLACMQ